MTSETKQENARRPSNIATQLENLIRSDREGNWDLHLQTVQALLPIFLGFDSTKYIRWGSLYLENLRNLPQTAPEINIAFQDGKFVALKGNPVDYLQGFDHGFEDEVERAESYLVKVLENGTTCTTMDELRDHNYYRSKTSLEKLPSTSHAIKAHILRAYYATYPAGCI